MKMNEVVFHPPVYVGDVVSFYAKVVRIGKTSITVKVTVDRRALAQNRARP